MSQSDAIPEFSKSKSGEGGEVSLTNLSAFSGGIGIKSGAEIIAILAVAVCIIGGAEFALRFFEVPHYIMPPPSEIDPPLWFSVPPAFTRLRSSPEPLMSRQSRLPNESPARQG